MEDAQAQTAASPFVKKAEMKVIVGLCFIHFIGDFYISFVNPLLPSFVERFSLTLTEVGLLAGLNRLLAFVVQPSVGYLADHYRTRFFVLGGPFLTVLAISLMGLAPSFPALLGLVALGSMGTSMFHPTSAGMVSSFAGSHLGFSLSVFNMGGTLGMALGPLFIAFLVARYGLSATPWAMLIGLAMMAFLVRAIPLPEGEGLKRLGFIGSMKENLKGVWRFIFFLWLFCVLRTFVNQSFLTFVPILYSKEGFDLFSIGLIVSLFSLGGALSEVICGHLSDRIGFKPIFYVTNTLAMVFLYLLLYLPGRWVFVSAFGAGFFAMATLPLTLAMAQRLAPRAKSMVSSLMMGLAFGIGGMLAPFTGKLSDLLSIRPVLCVLAVVPFLTIVFIYLLPEERLKARS